ncbi:MAG: hypothetical protein QMD46_10705 [Methanomicrobiales archaeon]|nr:hypothetical protein [Methanomicrobiales archaeon]MDI6876628.1 hypothetical protein [Methanomicrobiales archaeon]
MYVLKCRRCGGSGLVPNDAYALCRLVKSEEARRYFGMTADAEDPAAEWVRTQCGPEETVICGTCNGAGTIEFDDEDWELIVVPAEDGEE